MNINGKNLLITFLLILTVGLGFSVYMTSLETKNMNDFIRQIDSLQMENVILNQTIDSLSFENDSLDFIIEASKITVKQKEAAIKALNERRNEEINRIDRLPVDSAIVFLSEKLSAEDSI